MERAKSQEQNVVFNEQILQEIDKMENYQNDLDYQLGVVGKKVTTLHGEIQVLKTKSMQNTKILYVVGKLVGIP